MSRYDFVVIGSGGGLMFIEGALGYNKKCAIVENAKFGGTCLTKGCIPSKMLVYPADLIREAEEGTKIGVTFQKPSVNWQTVSKRVWLSSGNGTEMPVDFRISLTFVKITSKTTPSMGLFLP